MHHALGAEIKSINFMEAVDGVSQSFDELFDRYGVKPFPGWAIEDIENRFPSSWRKGQTSGGIASGLSHLDITELLWDKVVMVDSSGEPQAGGTSPVLLIMEDDCVLTGNDISRAWEYFTACLADADTHVPNWDMIMLGAAGHRPDIALATEVRDSHNIEISGFSYLTTMYFISNRGVAKLRQARSVCLENMLAFDELHNALARLTSRRDVDERFFSTEPLVLLSSKISLVRQDPFDCVHDTMVTSGCRRGSLPLDHRLPSSGTGRETISPFSFQISLKSASQVGVCWWRRRLPTLSLEKVIEEFGCRHSMTDPMSQTLSPTRSPVDVVSQQPLILLPPRTPVLQSESRPPPNRRGMLSFMISAFEKRETFGRKKTDNKFPSSFDQTLRGGG